MSRPVLNDRLADPGGHPDFAATASRPASLWPESTQPADLAAAGMAPDFAPDVAPDFATTRFDPVAEERARLQTQAAAAFDVCHPALALRALLLVQAVLALQALAGADSVADWGARQAVLAFAGVAGTLLWLVTVCALRRPLHATSAPLRAALVLGLGALAALLAWLPLQWAGLAGEVSGVQGGIQGGMQIGIQTGIQTGMPSGIQAGMRTAAVLLTGMAFAALLWAWLDLRSRIWHPAHASARLAELQSRIRPHFLFNALNTALALVRVDPERAENVLEDLAQLFRSALADAGASVSLADEIELARRYLAIEQLRFGDRLAVQWQIDPRTHAARVPPLVLQPLVENAVRHGVEPAARGGRVAISARLQRGQVVVQVSNTLAAAAELADPQHAPAGQTPPGHGMALHNLRERLRLLHDVAAQCDVWHEPAPAAVATGVATGAAPSAAPGAGGTFHARLTLPLP